MKAPKLSYHRAANLGEALAALDSGNARVLAGGQSLILQLNQRLVSVQRLIDICQIGELQCINETDSMISIGAAVTTSMIEDGTISGPTGAFLQHVAGQIGYRGVRNRGTLVGGVAFADPAADWPTAFTALNALVVIASVEGTREIPIRDLYAAPFQTSLASHELITAIKVPRLSAKARWSYWKFSPTIGEVTKAIAVVLQDGETHRITLGAGTKMPCGVRNFEQRWAQEGEAFLADLNLAECRNVIAELGAARDDYHEQCLAVAVQRALSGLK
ncbi:MAG: FAD binding domain-containing protein [Pseudomonadota bacterium]